MFIFNYITESLKQYTWVVPELSESKIARITQKATPLILSVAMVNSKSSFFDFLSTNVAAIISFSALSVIFKQGDSVVTSQLPIFMCQIYFSLVAPVVLLLASAIKFWIILAPPFHPLNFFSSIMPVIPAGLTSLRTKRPWFKGIGFKWFVAVFANRSEWNRSFVIAHCLSLA